MQPVVPRGSNPPGMQCGGAKWWGGVDDLLEKAGASDPINIIANNIESLTPLFQTDGFDMGGFTTFSDMSLLSIETQTDSDCPSCREYFGFTAKLAPSPTQDP